MRIKRGVYTRVDSRGIESNEGTFFEAVMAPTYVIPFAAGDATADVDVSIAHTSCSISSVVLRKVGAGGAGDGAILQRVRGAVVDAICTFDLNAAVSGDTMLPDSASYDVTVDSLLPGDTLRLAVTKAAGSPACEVEVQVRID